MNLWPPAESSLLLLPPLVVSDMKQCVFQLAGRFIAGRLINGSLDFSCYD